MKLEDLRGDIDRIDARIVALLSERMEKALLTKRFKKATLDEGREQAVLAAVAARSACLAEPAFTEGLYRAIMAESRRMQERGLSLLGFQGVHGAYSDAAARAWLPGAATLPCKDFKDIFDGVQEGYLDYGIVPVENTLGGTVGQVNSILVNSELRIVGAVDLPVEHCLLALPGQDHRDIRYAYSHPQALAQCRRFLERNRLDGISYFDTAGSARMLAEERPRSTAAIAGRFAAELYGLEIIKEGIQDAATNRTRFFVLAKEGSAAAEQAIAAAEATAIAGGTGKQAEESASPAPILRKCSAVFSTDDKAGTLFTLLEVFAKAGINLTRIESAPYEPGDYAMFLDFEGAEGDEAVKKAIAQAKGLASSFRLLGAYLERKL
ncbi:MAG TPA: bifunctional chorismate mutase/prephenate dehydratase [Spirochaetaceae bacterium]|jgi:prephenate dehydratase/chorismate mutase/prephenate dehydratase|nr:bifunctional chorismate mutase/prephenate dehydratase [Spirochaetaceae bacterium]